MRATNEEYFRIESLWAHVKSRGYILEQSEYQQLIDFTMNVSQLSDSNNSDYNMLDARDKQMISFWVNVVNDITNNINIQEVTLIINKIIGNRDKTY